LPFRVCPESFFCRKKRWERRGRGCGGREGRMVGKGNGSEGASDREWVLPGLCEETDESWARA